MELSGYLKALETRVNELEEKVDSRDRLVEVLDGHLKMATEKTEPTLYDRCPVFLETPKTGNLYYQFDYDSMVVSRRYKQKRDLHSYMNGRVWKREKAVRKYPNNPGLYKYLQIIWRDFGGEPNEDDWKDIYITKYCLGLWSVKGCFSVSDEEHTFKQQGIIYMLKEPHINEIVNGMGDLIEWLK